METKAEAFRLQNQIKENATELSDYFQELGKWEKSIRKKDKLLHKGKRSQIRSRGSQIPIRNTGGTFKIRDASATTSGEVAEGKQTYSKSESAAAHTYDKGYKKWDEFDVDKELQSIDSGKIDEEKTSKDDHREKQRPILTPASITASAPKPSSLISIPKARGLEIEGDPEEQMRKLGNEHFKKGEFLEAIKYYTRCLGINSNSILARSNRAMAYLKLKEFQKAEDDCSICLNMDPKHIKSLQRRASAKSALGKHRSALIDLQKGLECSPSSKEILTELRKTQELYRSAIRRAPKKNILASIEQMPPGRNDQLMKSVKENTGSSHSQLGIPPATHSDELNGKQIPNELEHIPVIADEPTVALTHKGSQCLGNTEVMSCKDVFDDSQPENPQQTQFQNEQNHLSHHIHKLEKESVLAGVSSKVSQFTATTQFSNAIEHEQNQVTTSTSKMLDEDPMVTSTMLKYFKERADHKSPGPDFTQKIGFPEHRSSKQASVHKGIKSTALAKSNKTVKKKKRKLKAPKTSYELERAWRSLKGNADGKAEYIKSIAPRMLPNILQNMIETEILCGILETVSIVFLQRPFSDGKGSTVISWLQQISLTPRFEMTILLLSESEKGIISNIFQDLEVLFKDEAADTDKLKEIRKLKQTYHLLP